ncbi:hypothetical protein BH11VER1_BH11VER1_32320 [soil metagenome]
MMQRYKILEQLGGSGVVYKAYDTLLNRYVAIKRLMSHEEASTEDKITDMKMGVSLLTTLQHPCIATTFESSSDEIGFFMVMELVEGINLQDFITGAPLGLQDFEALSSQCMEALTVAHQRGILHLDLKPENIKVTRLQDGKLHAKLVDFHLPYPTFVASLEGASVQYLAPEQLRQEFLDARTDLYALGCIFYQALSRRRPFDGDTREGGIQAHLQHCVYPLRDVLPTLPQPVCDWVMWLINFNPAHRPANAEQAMFSLMEISAAGWFRPMPTVSQAPPQPAQQRFSYATQRPPTGRLPSGGIPMRPPTGRISQRITTSLPQYPGMMMQPVMVRRKHPVPIWVYIAAASTLVLGVGSFFLFNAKASSAAGVVSRSADFLQPGYVVHFRAGVAMNGQSNGAMVNRGVTVESWQSDGGLMKGLALTAAGSGPAYLTDKPDSFLRDTAVIRFDQGQSLSGRTDVSNSLSKEYPFGEYSKTKGVTIMLLIRPSAADGEKLCLRLRNQEDKCFVDVRAMPKKGFKLRIKAGDDYKETKVNNRVTSEFNLIGFSWNNDTGKATLAVRGENGDLERTEVKFSGNLATATLNEIYIGATGDSKGGANDQFAGDIVELAVWPFPMEWEDRSGQEMRLMEDYFKNTGTRY